MRSGIFLVLWRGECKWLMTRTLKRMGNQFRIVEKYDDNEGWNFLVSGRGEFNQREYQKRQEISIVLYNSI